MAKRTRAPAPRGRATQTRPRKPSKEAAAQTGQASLARRRIYTPECLAYMRQRFEQSEDSLADIGADIGVPTESVRQVAKREHWKRYVRPPHALPPAVKLPAQIDRAGDALAEAAAAESRAGSDIPLLADTIARLHRAVLDELAAIETLRARSSRAAGSARTARALASLTETLRKLQSLQPISANTGPVDDDMPADIDEFRNALARRIEAFVAERTDADAGGGSGIPSTAGEV